METEHRGARTLDAMEAGERRERTPHGILPAIMLNRMLQHKMLDSGEGPTVLAERQYSESTSAGGSSEWAKREPEVAERQYSESTSAAAASGL
ncbi:hypothetical protein BT96DRAFT_1007168 [Gymnopus androsaceus JB14]|uniref:Uncharacterized protein n=1 Tax=Gymnopus androsaceus JB14 TaxID=1447944 RepID=A0A6A4GI13_9AGAR|nr:hypothetical protein BT96DRAFT_1007168 [Gymnopus androsaceus JB14]